MADKQSAAEKAVVDQRIANNPVVVVVDAIGTLLGITPPRGGTTYEVTVKDGGKSVEVVKKR